MSIIKEDNGLISGGGSLETKIIDFNDNVNARVFNNLTVGKKYRIVAETPWAVGTVTFALSSAVGCTPTVVTAFTRLKNTAYSAWLGYAEYEIEPTSTSITLTFDRGDTQHFIFMGENASQITSA